MICSSPSFKFLAATSEEIKSMAKRPKISLAIFNSICKWNMFDEDKISEKSILYILQKEGQVWIFFLIGAILIQNLKSQE